MRLTVALRVFAYLAVMVAPSAQQSSPTNSSTDAPTTETTTTTASTTTTTAATTTVNVHPNPSVNQICPQGPDSTDRVRVNALQGHNFRRSQLARGRVKKNNGNTLPKAANMRRLQYSCDLESSARQSAMRCQNSQWSNLPSGVQENTMVFSKSRAQYRKDAILVAVKHWWSQIRKNNGPGQRVIFRNVFQSSKVSWFTRMAWATTYQVGCFVHHCSGNRWSAVCHYSPGGNIVRQNIYATGRPCSQCPTGTFCNGNKLCASA